MKNQDSFKKNLTIPNLISVLRILIVPFFVYYFVNDQIILAVILILFSGFTDLIDGVIARKFNQITELGKMLDPLADKITQISIAICFAVKFTILIPFMGLFFVKEVFMLIFATKLIAQKKKPCAAKWFGKVATALFYLSASTIVFMDITNVNRNVFIPVAMILLSLTAVMMVYSAFGYYKVYKTQIKSEKAIQINPKDKN